MKSILFISHQSNRSGAPLVLLYLLRWLKKNHEHINISVLSLKEGDLSDEFAEVSNLYMELPEGSLKQYNFQNRIQSFFQTRKNKSSLKKIVNKLDNHIDVIYANTIASLPLAAIIKGKHSESKVVAHVHELESVINLLLPNLNQYNEIVTTWIAASDLVKNNLIFNHKIPEIKINRIYEFTRLINPKKENNKSNFVIGGAGTVEWRKGVDLFIQVANYINIKHPNLKINFSWAGKVSMQERKRFHHDLKNAGLENMVLFTGLYTDTSEAFKNYDLLLMTSREDPFPLVCIEAGMMGIPIICFEGVTGTEEIIKKGGGKIVPYLNIENMAEIIVQYFNNRRRIKNDGTLARNHFSRFVPENMCPEIFQILEKIVSY